MPGLNVIDTAECYEGSEELIGKTVADRRADYYLLRSAVIRAALGAKTGRQPRSWKASNVA